MTALLNDPFQSLVRPQMGLEQRMAIPSTQQSMSSRHYCLCCSGTLLRHISQGKVYWHCSHCYQNMPV